MGITLAIFSPNKTTYSETFIAAHRNLPFSIRYYYGDWLPIFLENGPDLFRLSLSERVKLKINKDFSVAEHALANSLKKEKVNVVLAEYGPTASASLKALQFLGLPMVVHFHGFDVSMTDVLAEQKDRYGKVFNYASAIMAVSSKMKQDLLALGCPEHKIHVSAYGPNPSFFDVKPTYEKQEFVAPGRFTDKKAPYLTILAFNKIAREFPGAILTMIGDGELLNTCRNLTKVLGIADRVVFAGVKGPDEVMRIFSQATAMVQHSIRADSGDSEGTPVSVIEAQAAALPVIATRHAGIPDVVVHGQTGLLCNELDVDGMAENMKSILSDKSLALLLGQQARERIRQSFTMERHLSYLASTIQEAVEQKRAKPV